MKLTFILGLMLGWLFYPSLGQNIEYNVSFEKVIHHIADIEVVFKDIGKEPLVTRMSRSSPGRYALHEFAKNVYDVTASDQNGNDLNIQKKDPYQWEVINHKGYVKIHYKLFANRGDGTYSQIDETHGHLNSPATFMYAPDFKARPHQITFNLPPDLDWRVATQLEHIGDGVYRAPDLDYLMDSPIELSNYQLKEFVLKHDHKKYKIQFVLHGEADAEDFNDYFEKVQKIVLEEVRVFGDLPDFDFKRYTFLACYAPNVNGDGMEHRNSTILTESQDLNSKPLNHIATAAHEFFHSWNVERIRPKSLEPFDFEEANMSDALWFAEGFTNYYTNLILCRTGLISEENYLKRVEIELNAVWNAPGINHRSPIEMSYQAPFVDAARSVDPVNRENTFVSYYTYGSVLGLALDLALRNMNNDLTLDGYMQLIWQKYGIPTQAYELSDLRMTLAQYAGAVFADFFFESFIYNAQQPNYQKGFENVGISYEIQNSTTLFFGAMVSNIGGKFTLVSNPLEGTSSYQAGLSYGDVILEIGGEKMGSETSFDAFIRSHYLPGQATNLIIERYGKTKSVHLEFKPYPQIILKLLPHAPANSQFLRRKWLDSKTSK